MTSMRPAVVTALLLVVSGCSQDTAAGGPDPGTVGGGGDARAPGGVDPDPPDGDASAPSVCSSDNWCWSHPLPTGNSIHGVWGSSAHDVWAVGAGGTIVHWDGTRWSSFPGGGTRTLFRVTGSSASDV